MVRWLSGFVLSVFTTPTVFQAGIVIVYENDSEFITAGLQALLAVSKGWQSNAPGVILARDTRGHRDSI